MNVSRSTEYCIDLLFRDETTSEVAAAVTALRPSRRADARKEPVVLLDHALGVAFTSHSRAFVRAMTRGDEHQPLLIPASEGSNRKSGASASRLAGTCVRDARIPDRDKRVIDPEGILAGPSTRVPLGKIALRRPRACPLARTSRRSTHE